MSVVSDVKRALQEWTVPYWSHAGQNIAGVKLRQAIEYTSKGVSAIRDENAEIIRNQRAIEDKLDQLIAKG